MKTRTRLDAATHNRFLLPTPSEQIEQDAAPDQSGAAAAVASSVSLLNRRAESRTLTLLLVRHGETASNAEGRFQGQRDVPLSPVGEAQARMLAARLRRAWNTLPPFFPGPPALVYASDLSRAARTAEILMEDAWLREAIRPSVQRMPQLRERCYGAWEGLTRAEIRQRFGEQAISQGEAEGAERWEEVHARMLDAFERIWVDAYQQEEEETVALVAGHGGSLRSLLCRALGTGGEELRAFRLDNTGLCVVRFTGQERDARTCEGRVLLVNDTAHIEYASSVPFLETVTPPG